MAHVGVIVALEEAGITPNLVVGTSMGSVIGAIFTQTNSAQETRRRVLAFMESPEYKELDLSRYNKSFSAKGALGNFIEKVKERVIVNLSISNKAFFKQDDFLKALQYMIASGKIENFKIPYAAVASDLITGKKIVFSSGDVITAVLASSSIPGFLPPVQYSGYDLVDGEVSDLVPAFTAKEIAPRNFTIAVDVSQPLNEKADVDNALDIIFRANQIKSHDLRELRMKSADFLIRPNVEKYHWTDFSACNNLIDIGYASAKEHMPALLKAISRRRWMFWK